MELYRSCWFPGAEVLIPLKEWLRSFRFVSSMTAFCCEPQGHRTLLSLQALIASERDVWFYPAVFVEQFNCEWFPAPRYFCSGLSSSFRFFKQFQGLQCATLRAIVATVDPLARDHHSNWRGCGPLIIGLRKLQMQPFPWVRANKAFELKRVL